MNRIIVRELTSADWERFREMRLHALQTARGVFGSSYEQEVTKTPEEWKDVVRGPSHQVFGAFDGDDLAGIAAVFPWREDPSGSTAILAMWFVLQEYRGRGLARQLCETSLSWIRKQAQFKRVVVSHRESNEAPRRVTVGQDFAAFDRRSVNWHDGGTEDEVLYELRIGEGKAR